MQVTRLSDGV